MISRDEMFEPMLAALPSFRPIWDEFVRDWRDDGDDLPGYIALGDLARHLIALHGAGEGDSLRSAFAVVERWHVDGDDYVREAATVGLLEGIQNNCSHGAVDAGVFVAFLGPETKRWWDKLEGFWERGEPMVDDE